MRKWQGASKITRRNLMVGSSLLLVEAGIPILTKVAKAADGFLDIVAQEAEVKIAANGPPSDLWAYNGIVPGPEIRVKKGERVKVRFTNHLSEPTSIHWHGIRIENSMDGVSGMTQDPVQPGDSFVYDFIVPDSGTYWYHAHHKSWNQVARGLYGTLIVEEEVEHFDSAHDITLVMDDWRLNREGALDINSLGSLMDWSHAGRLGNYLTINGKSSPTFDLKSNEAYRLRLINVSNARVLGIDPNRLGASVIAYDGQPIEAPKQIKKAPLLIGPSQRVDLLLVPKQQGSLLLEEVSFERPITIAKFNVSNGLKSTRQVPILKSNSLPEPDLSNAKVLDLEMTGGAMRGFSENILHNGKPMKMADIRSTKQTWALNGVANLAMEPFFSIKKDETIILNIRNATAFLHAMHVHGHHFKIISNREGGVAEGQAWRDTFLIEPDQTTKIAFVADNLGKWLLHCHMLEHAAAGMNTWFEVT